MSKQLVGMLLCIFVKENMLANISDIKSSSTGVGLMGMMGNKGGVAIRFTYFDTSICFVNSHLSAHKEYELRRNQDYRDICRRIFAEEFISIFEHEFLFIFYFFFIFFFIFFYLILFIYLFIYFIYLFLLFIYFIFIL